MRYSVHKLSSWQSFLILTPLYCHPDTPDSHPDTPILSSWHPHNLILTLPDSHPDTPDSHPDTPRLSSWYSRLSSWCPHTLILTPHTLILTPPHSHPDTPRHSSWHPHTLILMSPLSHPNTPILSKTSPYMLCHYGCGPICMGQTMNGLPQLSSAQVSQRLCPKIMGRHKRKQPFTIVQDRPTQQETDVFTIRNNCTQ